MLKVADIGERLNVSTRTVVRWIEEGKLQAYQFGKDYRIEEEDYQMFLEESKVKRIGD